MRKLEGKVAIVTGAGQGIGRGMALAFAKEGAKVVIADINGETAGAVAQEILQLREKARSVVCDVSSEDQVKWMVAETLKEFGNIDVLVNNAQRFGLGLPEELDEASWDINFDTGPKATWFCCKAVFPHMKDKGGKIINFGSGAGINGYPHQSAYAAAKEAIRGLSRSMARAWGKYNINVNVICPSAATPALETQKVVHPDFVDKVLALKSIHRWADPELDIGRTAVFLASKDADLITGQTIIVDGGYHML